MVLLFIFRFIQDIWEWISFRIHDLFRDDRCGTFRVWYLGEKEDNFLRFFVIMKEIISGIVEEKSVLGLDFIDICLTYSQPLLCCVLLLQCRVRSALTLFLITVTYFCITLTNAHLRSVWVIQLYRKCVMWHYVCVNEIEYACSLL